MRLPDLGALEHLPENVQADENRDVDVRDKEAARVEGEEDVIAVNEDEDQTPCNAPNGEVRLECAVVRCLRAIEALCLFSAV